MRSASGWTGPWPRAGRARTAIWFTSVFGVLMAISWIWPITLYIGGESDAIDFDEGFLVLFLLLVPASMAVLVFAAVTIAAQAIKRRPLAKSIFNVGQVVTSAGVGAAGLRAPARVHRYGRLRQGRRGHRRRASATSS